MADVATASPATARRLRVLRLRMAGLLGALLLVVVTVFAIAVLRLDDRLRAEQDEAALLRELDDTSRVAEFDEGELNTTEVTAAIGELTAVVVRPDFDVLDLIDDPSLSEVVPEPDGATVDRLVAEVWNDLDEELQIELLVEAGLDDLSDAEALDSLIENPPDDLFDEAYRIHLTDEAERLGIELDPVSRLYRGPGIDAAVSDTTLVDLAERIMDDDEAGPFTLRTDDQRWDVRGTVLRDGPETRGAVLALVDRTASEAAHRDLRNQVLVIGAALVALSSLAAWWLAGRSIRPAASALGQQERFLAAAAHELRTPIAAIRATAEAPTASEGAEQRLDRVAELATGASVLTDDLLLLARMDADRLELQTTPVRLDLLVEVLVDDLPMVEIDTLPVVADADPGLIERAVDNLVRNAMRHGGATLGSPVRVLVDERGVVVEDRGPGVSSDDAERIFERFHSGPASKGHGLGLPLARWIARAHGGDLTLEPSDQGARFRLLLDVRRVS